MVGRMLSKLSRHKSNIGRIVLPTETAALSRDNAQHMTSEGRKKHTTLPDSRATGWWYWARSLTKSFQTLATLAHVHGVFQSPPITPQFATISTNVLQ